MGITYAEGKAYLAGIMDSDGSFSITKRHVDRAIPNYTCMVQLTWTHTAKSEEFMEFLVERYGGSFFIGAPSGTSNYPNTKPVIKYCATATAAEKIATAVLPYLFLKKQQAENIIKARQLSGSFGGKKRPQEVTDQLHALFVLNKELNTKNGVL